MNTEFISIWIFIPLLIIFVFLIVLYFSVKKRKKKPALLLINTKEELKILGKKVIKEADKVKAAEKMLLVSDAGVHVSSYIIKKALSEKGGALEDNIYKVIYEIVNSVPMELRLSNDRIYIFLVIGVNGVGKTLSCVKIAHFLTHQGYSPLLIAGDTFRAAAIEQIITLGRRVNIPVFHQKEGAAPSAVVFDGISYAKREGYNPVIIDTAGRSHVNQNLIEELKKVVRVIEKVNSRKPDEIFVVVDANIGQSSIRQILSFKEVGDVSGIILTKMDSTAKGGVVLHIIREEGIPVKFVSFGEDVESIDYFNPERFAQEFCEPFNILKGGGL